MQLGQGNGDGGSLEVADHAIHRDGTELDSCVITKASYRAKDESAATEGQNMLGRFGAELILHLSCRAIRSHPAFIMSQSRRTRSGIRGIHRRTASSDRRQIELIAVVAL